MSLRYNITKFFKKLEVILYTVPAKRYFENKSAVNNQNLLTLHSAGVVFESWRLKPVRWSTLTTKMVMEQWGQAGETSFINSMDTLARKKKKLSSNSGPNMKLQFSSESLFSMKVLQLSQAFTHLSHFSKKVADLSQFLLEFSSLMAVL